MQDDSTPRETPETPELTPPDPSRALPSAEPEQPSAGVREAIAQDKTLFCTQCGAKMAAPDRYCSRCGWDSQRPEAPPPSQAIAGRPRGPVSPRNRLAALLLCVLLGWVGAHRFYVGRMGSGVVWLLTFGLLSIGMIYDMVMIATGEFTDAEGRQVWNWQ